MLGVLLAPYVWWSWTVLALAALLRVAVAVQVGLGVVHDRGVLRHLWLLSLRDVAAFWVWFLSFGDNTVHWRGEIFILEKARIRPAEAQRGKVVTAADPDDKVSAHW